MAYPLMPKATAVWLVDNTALTFDQIADFCGLHPLEVQALADGDVNAGIMGTSPLLGSERVPERPEGTGTDRLGPSDSSDSGSDIVGADGAVDTDELGLSAEDIRRERGAGADIGDANLDSNTDASGTGERAEAVGLAEQRVGAARGRIAHRQQRDHLPAAGGRGQVRALRARGVARQFEHGRWGWRRWRGAASVVAATGTEDQC